MPFYEYECPHCGYDEEVLQKITDKPLTQCPSCGKKGLKKLMSAPLFRLKGSGWYETDFKGDKENKRNLAVEKEPDTASDSKPAKTDAKADAKADAKPAAESKPATEAKPTAAKTASKSRAKPKPVAKAKAKPAARRKAR